MEIVEVVVVASMEMEDDLLKNLTVGKENDEDKN